MIQKILLDHLRGVNMYEEVAFLEMEQESVAYQVVEVVRLLSETAILVSALYVFHK